MKHLIRFSLVVLALLAPSGLHAWTYASGDLLLVVRKPGYDNILFNLGPVSAYSSAPVGTERVVTSFDLGLITAKFGAALTDDVRFALIAATSPAQDDPRVWLGSADSVTPAKDRTPSQWQLLWSKVDAIGSGPVAYTGTNVANSFVASPSLIVAYDYVTSSAGGQPGLISTLGGASAFPVETPIPGELQFVEIRPSTANPKGVAPVVGRFRFTGAGGLTFSRGSGVVDNPPGIVGVVRTAEVTTVSVASVSGASYRLWVADAVGGASAWQVSGGVVAGTGAVVTLQHTNGAVAGFYRVELLR